jgi:uncharacterized protein (TIGR01244 family)
MALTITKHNEQFSSSPQINPEDVAEIVQLGFKSIINARPDNEGGVEQPLSDNLKIAAEAAGLTYIHIPVIPSNIQPSDVDTCASFVSNAPTPVLGFCKTGMRAISLYKSTQQASQVANNISKQKWLMTKVTGFFKNKCLLTKLYRKITTTKA